MSVTIDGVRQELKRIRSSYKYYSTKMANLTDENEKQVLQLHLDELNSRIHELCIQREQLKYDNCKVGKPRNVVKVEDVVPAISENANKDDSVEEIPLVKEASSQTD